MMLRCASCHIPISGEVQLLNDRSRISADAKSDFVPQGYYLIASAADQMDSHTAGEFILNLKDTMNIKPYSDPSRLSGCCALDGLNGINTTCVNGHEMGFERSDCWVPHYIHIPPQNVQVLEHAVV
jgi:hypothetical protein